MERWPVIRDWRARWIQSQWPWEDKSKEGVSSAVSDHVEASEE